MPPDPISQAEKMIRSVNDGAGKYTKPVLSRYPLLFALLVTFSVAAIMDGFKILVGQIEIFEHYPIVLIAIGILGLLLTGKLYQALGKGE